MRILRGCLVSDVVIYHNFQPPPYGGSSQFLRALKKEFDSKGLSIKTNRGLRRARSCLFNSETFPISKLRSSLSETCHMVHRVDGPVSLYRGFDNGSDELIEKINQEFAEVTILQSQYSLKSYEAMGVKFKAPRVVMNAPDPEVFFPVKDLSGFGNRKIRLITSSWSDNPSKGAKTLKWLDRYLDWTRYEYTFVGRISVEFDRIVKHPPVGPKKLADILRDHDVYVAASRNDPCSNALLEGLACGLPAIYHDSGGHAEIVGGAGFSFSVEEEMPALLERITEEYEATKSRIRIESMRLVAERYLDALGIASA